MFTMTSVSVQCTRAWSSTHCTSRPSSSSNATANAARGPSGLKTTTMRGRRTATRLMTRCNSQGAGDTGNRGAPLDQDRANKVLGLKNNATSDELVRAKNKLLEEYVDDDTKRAEVEEAYDVLLMKSFMKRTKGETQVDNKVRYADVVPQAAKIKAALPPWARDVSSAVPAAPTFSKPANDTLSQTSAVFGAIALVTLIQGLTQPAGVDSPPGLEISAALGATVWYMNKKRVKLGRAVLLAFAALIVGSSLGGAIQGWLRVDIVPLAGISSPSTVVSEFGILSLFVAAAFFD
mmetsp:Transcript_3585/g.12974  ORF Transcript_3585/g.12974 Transcript_3585/m.12974 type:complete len:292 (-) Transcript_3585:118-993(-)